MADMPADIEGIALTQCARGQMVENQGQQALSKDIEPWEHNFNLNCNFMLGQRRRRWPSIELNLDQSVVLAERASHMQTRCARGQMVENEGQQRFVAAWHQGDCLAGRGVGRCHRRLISCSM